MVNYIILEKKYKDNHLIDLMSSCKDLKKIDMNDSLKENLNVITNEKENLLIIVTEKILYRKNKYYRIIKNYIKHNKIKFIEVGLKKSSVEEKKAISNILIHGLEDKSWKIIKKLIKKL